MMNPLHGRNATFGTLLLPRLAGAQGFVLSTDLVYFIWVLGNFFHNLALQ